MTKFPKLGTNEVCQIYRPILLLINVHKLAITELCVEVQGGSSTNLIIAINQLFIMNEEHFNILNSLMEQTFD